MQYARKLKKNALNYHHSISEIIKGFALGAASGSALSATMFLIFGALPTLLTTLIVASFTIMLSGLFGASIALAKRYNDIKDEFRNIFPSDKTNESNANESIKDIENKLTNPTQANSDESSTISTRIMPTTSSFPTKVRKAFNRLFSSSARSRSSATQSSPQPSARTELMNEIIGSKLRKLKISERRLLPKPPKSAAEQHLGSINGFSKGTLQEVKTNAHKTSFKANTIINPDSQNTTVTASAKVLLNNAILSFKLDQRKLRKTNTGTNEESSPQNSQRLESIMGRAFDAALVRRYRAIQSDSDSDGSWDSDSDGSWDSDGDDPHKSPPVNHATNLPPP